MFRCFVLFSFVLSKILAVWCLLSYLKVTYSFFTLLEKPVIQTWSRYLCNLDDHSTDLE